MSRARSRVAQGREDMLKRGKDEHVSKGREREVQGYSEFFQNLPWPQRGSTLVGLNTNIYPGIITSMADLFCNHPCALSQPLVVSNHTPLQKGI